MKRNNRYVCGVMLMLCAVMVNVGRADAPRDVKISESDEKTVFSIHVAPDEQVLVAYMEGKDQPAFPVGGIDFPAETEKLALRLKLQVWMPKVSSDDQWRLYWGVSDETRFATVGASRTRAEGEVPVPVRNIILPVAIDGVEVHLIPFRAVGDHLHCMLVAIGRDRAAMRNGLRLLEHKNFDWQKSFKSADTFLGLSKQESQEQIVANQK